MKTDTLILMFFMTGLAMLMMVGLTSMLDDDFIAHRHSYQYHSHPEPNQPIIRKVYIRVKE